jgi:hypothetical protein
MERESDFYTDRDLGDENDYDPSKPEPLQGHLEDLLDPIIAEQLTTSLRVIAEADTLPPDMVEYHMRLLSYWGVIEIMNLSG